MRFVRDDGLALVALVAGTALFAVCCVDLDLPPVEDAAILMRYSRHLALGHGLVWNVGEPPVDGATDFLFAVAIGALHAAGEPLRAAALGLALAAHFATVVLVYLGVRWQGARIPAAAATAAFVAVGPGLPLAAAGFGATFFALALAIAWLLGQRIALAGQQRTRDCAAFALAALLAALIRPEGVLMAGFMTAAVAIALPAGARPRLIAVVAVVFVSLGGAFLLWRTFYFGQLLPTPFVRKGGGRLYWDGLRTALSNTVWLCLPFLPAYPLALASRAGARRALAFALPVAGFCGMWLLLSPAMNLFGRFQVPLLPFVALSWFPLVRELPAAPARRRRAFVALALAGAVAVVGWRALQTALLRRHREGNFDMALMLRDYAERGYVLATTEAGLLPLYSEWRTLDAWGLNEPEIARRGLARDDLLRRRPALVVWHDHASPLRPAPRTRRGGWGQMVATLHDYVEEQGYVLAAAFGRTADDSHYYWVDADLPDCEELVARIRALPYAWPGDGEPAIDLAAAAGASSPTCR